VPGRLGFKSGHSFEYENHSPAVLGDVIGRLPSDWLSIAKGRATVQEQRFDTKQLLQFAPSTPGR
jgi:hypothetical protein